MNQPPPNREPSRRPARPIPATSPTALEASPSPAPSSTPPLPARLLAAPGPIALALAVALLSPLALSGSGQPWAGLVVLAGAATFWWTLLWPGHRLAPPSAWAALPALALMALMVGWPLASGGAEFFRVEYSVADTLLPLRRESALLAAQKLVIVLLLAAPLHHALHLTTWSRPLFRMALLFGLAGLLAIGVLQMAMAPADLLDPFQRARLAMVNPLSDTQLAATLAASAVWLVGTLIGSLRRWRVERLDHEPGDWAAAAGTPSFLLAGLAGFALLAVALLAVLLVSGPVPWRQAAPWVGLAGGLGLIVLARPTLLRALGAALLVAGLLGAWSAWPDRLAAVALARGGWLGWDGYDTLAGDRSGLLGLVQSRGLLGLIALLATLTAAAAWQWRSMRRLWRSDPLEAPAAGGALAASWLMALGWLIGPAAVTAPAAMLALTFWAMSLSPPRPGPARLGGYVLCVAAAVLGAYGLLGFAPMAHQRLWLWLGGEAGSDKILHGVWGLYITLTLCVTLAPRGRWPGVLAGGAISIALAIAAEYVQLWYLPRRQFEWLDVAAYAAAAAVVLAAVLLSPGRRGPTTAAAG